MIIATYAELPRQPAWYLYLPSHPEATIQVKRGQIAETANPEKTRHLSARLTEVAPGYAKYQERTSREIPMVILHHVDGLGE